MSEGNMTNAQERIFEVLIAPAILWMKLCAWLLGMQMQVIEEPLEDENERGA
jgi:hypothetical protein